MWSSVDGRYLEHHAVDEDEQERSRPGPIKIEEQSSSIYPSPDCLWNSRESQTGAVVHDADCDFPPLGFDMPRGVAYHSPHYLKREEECDRSIDSPSTNMASASTPTSGTPSAGGKAIPLLCSVCPDTPKFSDVSHLLTHIASKGHLHQETQTKLRAHQDLASSLALQQYELWYGENGIEELLVERMKAKQVKEAARRDRNRATVVKATSKSTKRRARPSATAGVIKMEHDSYTDSFPVFPSLLGHNVDGDLDGLFISHDMMSLKGQVWPGMGKMDLANEDMKRTRNQRKPKSVIDRMRRISEGISPTQVVLTSNFEVELEKNVYDESPPPTPCPEEDTLPRKPAKAKRKRAPLTEVSVNAPRRPLRRAVRSASGKSSEQDAGFENGTGSPLIRPFTLHRNRDIFQDEGGTFDNRPYSTPTGREDRLNLRGRLHALNPISNSSLTSPTSAARDEPGPFLGREVPGGQSSPSYFDPHAHLTLSPYHSGDGVFGIDDGNLYNSHARVQYPVDNSGYNMLSQDHLRMSSAPHTHGKREEFQNSVTSDNLSTPSPGHLFDLPGANPLFSQDRVSYSSSHQVHIGQPSNFGFAPSSRRTES